MRPADKVCTAVSKLSWFSSGRSSSSSSSSQTSLTELKRAQSRALDRPRKVSEAIVGKMLEGKAVVSETDMRRTMQQEAVHLASKAIDIFDVTEATDIARFIKKEFDRSYGSGWQCVVGNDFGSFVTHCFGCFIYFCVCSLAFLLFIGSPCSDEADQFASVEKVSPFK